MFQDFLAVYYTSSVILYLVLWYLHLVFACQSFTYTEQRFWNSSLRGQVLFGGQFFENCCQSHLYNVFTVTFLFTNWPIFHWLHVIDITLAAMQKVQKCKKYRQLSDGLHCTLLYRWPSLYVLSTAVKSFVRDFPDVVTALYFLY